MEVKAEIPKLYKGDRFVVVYADDSTSSEFMICETLRKVSDYDYRTDEYVAVNLTCGAVAYMKGKSISELMESFINNVKEFDDDEFKSIRKLERRED